MHDCISRRSLRTDRTTHPFPHTALLLMLKIAPGLVTIYLQWLFNLYTVPGAWYNLVSRGIKSKLIILLVVD